MAPYINAKFNLIQEGLNIDKLSINASNIKFMLFHPQHDKEGNL